MTRATPERAAQRRHFQSAQQFRDWLTGTVAGFENGLGPAQGFAQFANGARVLVNAPVANQQYSQPTAVTNRNELTGSWLDAGALYHALVATAVPCD